MRHLHKIIAFSAFRQLLCKFFDTLLFSIAGKKKGFLSVFYCNNQRVIIGLGITFLHCWINCKHSFIQHKCHNIIRNKRCISLFLCHRNVVQIFFRSFRISRLNDVFDALEFVKYSLCPANMVFVKMREYKIIKALKAIVFTEIIDFLSLSLICRINKYRMLCCLYYNRICLSYFQK